MKKLFLQIITGVCITGIVTSCSVSDKGGTTPQTGFFLIANTSPGSPVLNITINGSTFPQTLGFGTYSPYYQATPGSYVFSFYDSVSTTTPILSNTVSIAASTNYSYFLIDSFSKIKPSLVQDVIPSPSPDSAYIRFFNFSPDAGTVYLKDSVAGIDLYTNRTFNDQSSGTSGLIYANFSRKLAGAYTFQIKLADSDSTIAASKLFTLSGGHVYTIFASGLLNGTGSQKISIGQITNY